MMVVFNRASTLLPALHSTLYTAHSQLHLSKLISTLYHLSLTLCLRLVPLFEHQTLPAQQLPGSLHHASTELAH
jgi:hypothetical protein